MTSELSKEEQRRSSLLGWYDDGVGQHKAECRWDEDNEPGPDCICGSDYLGAMQAVRSGAMRRLVGDYKNALQQAERERDNLRELLKQSETEWSAACDEAREALLDARERLSRWEQGFHHIIDATWKLSDAQDIAKHNVAEVSCQHEWGPLQDWDDEDEPWEQCPSCKANRPQREAMWSALRAALDGAGS